MTLLDAGDFDTAIACFDRVILADPNFALATCARGRAYLATGQPRHALGDFDQHIQTVASGRDRSRANCLADAYFYRGEAHAALDESETAIEDYSVAIRLDPGADNAYRRRGQAYARLVDGPGEYFYTAAIRDFTHLVKKNPQDPEALVERGMTHAANGSMYAAIADFTAAINADADFAPAYLQRGIAYGITKEQGDLTLAIADFDKAIHLDPKCAEAFYQRGLAHAELTGATELALSDFTEAIEWKPDYFDALVARGKLYDKTADYPKAIADLQEAVEVNAQSGEVFLALGNALHHDDRRPEATEQFQAAITLDPRRSLPEVRKVHEVMVREGKPLVETLLPPGGLYCAKGRIHLADSDAARRAGDTNGADELLNTAVGYLRAARRENPKNADTCYWLGEAYVGKGQTDQARECFQEAIGLEEKEHKKGHFPSYLAWGRLLCDRGDDGDYPTAADFLRRAVNLCGQSAEAHLFLARACLGCYRREQGFKVPELGETPSEAILDEAITHYLEAARLDAKLVDGMARELAEASRAKAQGYATRGQWDRAIEAVTTAIVYEPDQPSNYLLRATYRAGAGKADSACHDYEEAFARGLTPPQADTWPRIAKNLVLRKAQEDVREHRLQAALDKTQIAEMMKGQMDQALRDLEKAADDMPASLAELHVDIGDRYLQDRQFSLTIEQSNAAITWDDTNARAYWNRGVAIARLDRPVLWKNTKWEFAGWPPESDMPSDWMPNALPLTREITWNRKWETEWTEAWKAAWQADLNKAAALSLEYLSKLQGLNGRMP
jgi:tetratricopeptide (TPR) repeat protein